MKQWFECTAKYIRMDENGHERKVTETYLLDAMSFTEAEARITKELQTMVSGEFLVTKIARTNISEIIPSENGDRWYRAKVAFITINEETGKEKRTSQYVLVFSNSIKEAYDQIVEAMQGMMADFDQMAISESNILDVFPYMEEVPSNLKPVEPIRGMNTDIAFVPSNVCPPKKTEVIPAFVKETGEPTDVFRIDETQWEDFYTNDVYSTEELEFAEL